MAQEMYADRVASIREKLARINEDNVEESADFANNLTSEYNEKMKEYTDKWKGIQDAGGEELAGVLGVKGIYAGGKRLVDLYKGTQARKTAKKEKEQKDELDDDFDEDPEELDVGDGARQESSFQKDDGQKFFEGSDRDRQEFYDDDGDLKDPTRIPEGHQATGDEEPPQEDEQNEEDDNPFRMPDDVRDSLKKLPTDATDADQPSFVDVVAQGQRDREARRDLLDGAEDQPSDLNRTPLDSFETGSARPAPAQPDTSTDPFQPTPRDAPSVRSQFDRNPADSPADQSGSVGGEQPLELTDDSGSFLGRVGSKTFKSLAERGQGIRKGFGAVKDFFSPSGGATAGAEGAEAGTAGAEAGGELAGLGAGDAVLGAIPVIGEVGLAISGLVAIGEGIYHLFHPEDKPPPPKPDAPISAPHALTAKYASALPSQDNAVDQSGTITAF
jgi:hypothetical protein